MKNIYSYHILKQKIYILLLIISTFSLFSFTDVPVSFSNHDLPRDLIGIWKLKSIDVEQAVRLFKGDQKDFARKMINQAYDKYKGKLTLTFEEDGTYIISTPLINGQIQTEIGEWRINDNKSKLYIKIQNQDEENIRVLKLTNKILVIEVNNDGVGVMNMIYSKD